MPDEPTTEEMLMLIDRDIRGARVLLPGLNGGEDKTSLIREIIVAKAIRRRIERKVSGERIGKLLEDLQGSILFNVMHHVCILHRDEARSHILAMLKELGQEVDNA